MKKNKGLRFTTVYVVVLSVLLLLTNVLLGALLMRQSTNAVTQLVRKSMLNIVSTAAEIVDGDRLGSLTEENVGGPVFHEVKEELSAFQNNIDIEYIYAVKQIGEDQFVFTVDADPEDPAEFGEEVLVTAALRSAGKGIPMVDESPAEDEWGNFYSAYCPVLDSKGEIAGIIGVDFDATWYNEEIRSHTASAGMITIIAEVIGILIVSFMGRTLNKRFATITKELTVLSDDIDQLKQEIKSAGEAGTEQAEPNSDSPKEEGARDEIEEISHKVNQMHEVMTATLEYMQEKANTDGLTGVGNRTAYIEAENAYSEGIRNQSARFGIVVFDINDLKKINDGFGHITGDRIIIGAANVISAVFGKENVYRIGGDEFIAIVKDADESVLKEKIAALDQEVTRYNEAHTGKEGILTISAGGSVYNPETDHTFHDIFVRADKVLYARKEAYHRARNQQESN